MVSIKRVVNDPQVSAVRQWSKPPADAETKGVPVVRRTDYPQIPSTLAGYQVKRFDLHFALQPKTKCGKYHWLNYLRQDLINAFEALKRLHPELVIFPYFKRNQGRGVIEHSSHIPHGLTEIQVFFANIYGDPSSDGGRKMACRVLLGFKNNNPSAAFRGILDANNSTSFAANVDKAVLLCTRPIQTENIVSIGWFLYSFDGIDLKHLESELQSHFDSSAGEATITSPQIALSWRTIRIGKKTFSDKGQEQGVKAIHVEVDARDANAIAMTLLKMYGASTTSLVNLPSCLMLKFIPAPPAKLNTQQEQDFELLIKRQIVLQRQMGNNCVRFRNVMGPLDKPLGDSDGNFTLRKILMSIHSEVETNKPLFWYAHRDDEKNVTSLYFSNRLRFEARKRCGTIVSYVKHKYGESVVERAFLTRCRSSQDADSNSLLLERGFIVRNVLEFLDIPTIVQVGETCKAIQAMIPYEIKRRRNVFWHISVAIDRLMSVTECTRLEILLAERLYHQAQRLVGYEANYGIKVERDCMVLDKCNSGLPRVFMFPARFYLAPVGEPLLTRNDPVVHDLLRQVHAASGDLMANDANMDESAARSQVLRSLINNFTISEQTDPILQNELLRMLRRELCCMEPSLIASMSEQIRRDDFEIYNTSI